MFNQLIILSLLFCLGYSGLKILSPFELKAIFPTGIPYSLGNFGYVPYGQTLTALMQLSDPTDGCNRKSNATEPEFMTPEVFQASSTFVGSRISLVERGNCTFGWKSSQAERNGYSLVVVVDNKAELVNEVVMVDKNHTNQVNIPSVLISMSDGEKLVSFFKANPNKDVYVSILFDKPNATSIVFYQYWMSSMDSEQYQFIEQFRPFQKTMNSSLNFTPHYVMWQCLYCAQLNYTVKNADCLSGGRYCAFDPDNEGPLSGKDVVWQTLRQLCIFQQNPELWWSYVIQFGRQCLGTQYYNASQQIEQIQQARDQEQCALKVLQFVNANLTQIDQCMNGSFVGQDKDLDDNSVLSQEYEIQQQSGVQQSPMLVVNGQQYKGSISILYRTDKNNITVYFDTQHYGPLQMICEAFSEASSPDLCKERQRMYVDDKGNLRQVSSGPETWEVWITSIVLLLIVMLISIYCYRRQMRKAMQKELQLQVNMAISQYFSLNEKERNFVELKE